jgi:hypothetical protein
MRLTFLVPSLLAGLALACAAQAAAPSVQPVRWVATNPAIPHDIIADPSGGGGGVTGFTTIDRIDLVTLSTCGADTQTLSLNGTAVTSNLPNSCTCNPAIQTTTSVNPAHRAAWIAGDANNTLRLQKPGTGSHYGWAKAIVYSGGNALTTCLHDTTNTNCTTTNLCINNSTASVDVAKVAGAAGIDPYNSTLRAFVTDADSNLATYQWNFGDGNSSPVTAISGASALIATNHKYFGAVGAPFNATLTVCDTGGACATGAYPMVARADSTETKANLAIERALWYLFDKAKSRADGQIIADGSYGNMYVGTATAVNAFEAHGHVPGIAGNPYSAASAAGLNFLFSVLSSGAATAQNHVINGVNTPENPDSNGNGIYLQLAQSAAVYESGIAMDAILASGQPTATVASGALAGRTYASVIQDLVDGYAFGQMDTGGAPARGSWYYSYGNNQTHGHADNSSSGWAAIGMVPAERNWGAIVPAFVKRENLVSLEKMQQIGVNAGAACGQLGYSDRNCAWGCGATTPNGMLLLEMNGKGPGQTIAWDRNDNGDYADDSSWTPFDQAAGWLGRNWGSGANEANANTVLGYTYGMFAAVKALRIAGVTTLIPASGNTCPATLNAADGFDWYNDPTRGVAAVAVARQSSNGTWPATGPQVPTGLATQWYTIMMASALFQQGPKAVAAASAATVAPAQNVTFNHAGSYHLDAAKSIVTYEWDLDGNGTFEYSTQDINATPSTNYPSLVGPFPKTVTVTLKVTDNNNPALSDTAQVNVTIDIVNVPPVAVITQTGGTLGVNSPIDLSGATSSDPNAGPPPAGLNDTVVEYAWDLDDANGLNTFTTLGVAQTVQFATTGLHQVALRVKDSFGLTHTAFYTVDIPINRAPTANAGPDQTLQCVDGQAVVTLDGSLSSDLDGDVLSYAWSNGSTGVSPSVNVSLGATNLSLTVNDGRVNSASDSVTITVEDTAAPEVTCDDVLVECAAAAGTAVLESAFNALADDACEGPVDATSDGLLALYPLGNTPVSFSAADINGRIGRCDAEVLVQDTTEPTITCPAAVVLDADDACRAVSQDSATAEDTCDTAVGITSDAPVAYDLGDTTVTFTATDAQGNDKTCSRTVTVRDVTAPAPVCPADVAANTDAGSCIATVALGAATATDNCDSAPAISATVPTEFALGASTVEYSATDASNNSRACVTTVTVQDAEKPSIVCPGAITVPSDAAGCGTMVAVEPQSVADNCDAEVSVVSDAPVLFAVGETTVTLTARDNFGNAESCTVVVTVLDTTSPEVACPPSRIVDAPADACGVGVDFGTLSASDNCTSDLTVTDDAPDVFPLGNTTVTFWIEDAAGNITTCDSTIVTVLDVTKPTLTCPAPVSVNADAATCRQAVTLTATATDACQVAEVTGNGTESYPLGTTDHGFTATDGTGNQAVCSTPVTVVDATPPAVDAGADFNVNADTACTANADLHGSAGDACGVTRYQWQDETGAILGNTATLPVAMTGVGPHVFTLTACDAANNCASDSVTVTISSTAMVCFQVRHVNLKMSDRSGHGDDEDDEDDDAEDRRDCSRSRYLHNHLYTRGTFELNECNAVDLSVSGATVKIDGQTFTVPAGAFQVRSYHRYTYRSPKLDTGWWRLTVDLRKNRWTFKSWHMTNEGLNTADGLSVSVSLGTQVGSQTVALTRNGSAKNGYNYGFHARGNDCSQRCRGEHDHGSSCHHGRQHHEESCGHDDRDDHDDHGNRNRDHHRRDHDDDD